MERMKNKHGLHSCYWLPTAGRWDTNRASSNFFRWKLLKIVMEKPGQRLLRRYTPVWDNIKMDKNSSRIWKRAHKYFGTRQSLAARRFRVFTSRKFLDNLSEFSLSVSVLYMKRIRKVSTISNISSAALRSWFRACALSSLILAIHRRQYGKADSVYLLFCAFKMLQMIERPPTVKYGLLSVFWMQ